MQDRIEQSITIQASLGRVWEEVSHPGWWVPSRTPTPALGGPGQLVVRDTERWGRFEVEVVAVDPPAYAAFRWASEFPGELLGDGNSTLVEFKLEPTSDGVVVRVVESGFATLDVTPEVRAKARHENDGGWREELAALRGRAEEAPVA